MPGRAGAPRIDCTLAVETFDSVLGADLGHFLDLSDDAPRPARKMAEQPGNVVRAATAAEAGTALAERAAVPPTAGTKTLPWSHHRLPA